MIDMKGSGGVEVHISADGKRIWVNTNENGCVLRIQDIHQLVVVDDRKKR